MNRSRSTRIPQNIFLNTVDGLISNFHDRNERSHTVWLTQLAVLILFNLALHIKAWRPKAFIFSWSMIKIYFYDLWSTLWWPMILPRRPSFRRSVNGIISGLLISQKPGKSRSWLDAVQSTQRPRQPGWRLLKNGSQFLGFAPGTGINGIKIF